MRRHISLALEENQKYYERVEDKMSGNKRE
jgi:hypothetical protein